MEFHPVHCGFNADVSPAPNEELAAHWTLLSSTPPKCVASSVCRCVWWATSQPNIIKLSEKLTVSHFVLLFVGHVQIHSFSCCCDYANISTAG